MIKLKNILKEVTSVLEDNGIELNIDSWGGRGKNKSLKYHHLVIYDMVHSNRI